MSGVATASAPYVSDPNMGSQASQGMFGQQYEYESSEEESEDEMDEMVSIMHKVEVVNHAGEMLLP